MNPNTFVPSFYFYKLADAISSPYTSLMAYQAGNIDANGNVINSISSIDAFEYLVIKLKQIFDQLPYGTTKAKLNNYMATLQIFGEEVERYEITKEQFHCLIEGIISQNTNNEVSYLELLEDMATGGGAGAIGVPAEGGNINQGGVSGFDPRMGLPIMRRKKEQYFDNCEIFDVCPEEYTSFKNAKSWKEIPESETKNYLRRFQRRNTNAKIGVKGLNPLNGETELYWITYPAKNFMEDVDFGSLNFLFENIATTMTSIGKKTMLSMSVPSIPERAQAEQQNAINMFGDTKAPGNNVQNEEYLLDAIKQKLIKASYKFKEDVKSKEDLGIGEFGIFKEGGHESNSDIFVGMEHPKEKGKVHHVGIESGYNRRLQKQFLIPVGAKVTVPEDVEKMTGNRVKGQIDVGQALITHGQLSNKGSRISLWPTITSTFKRNPKKTKSRLRSMAHEAIRTKSDDLSLIGHEGRLAAVHHRHKDSDERNLVQKLLDQMEISHTHDLDEMGFARSPFYGGSTPKGKSTKRKIKKKKK